MNGSRFAGELRETRCTLVQDRDLTSKTHLDI